MALPPQVCAEEASVAGRRGRCRDWLPVPDSRWCRNVTGKLSSRLSLGRLFFHALKNEGCAVSGQNTLNNSHLLAFELLDMRGDCLGTALFHGWVGRPDHPHPDRRAIRLKLEFIFPAVSVGGAARDAGHLLCREISDLLARSSRQLDGRYGNPSAFGLSLDFNSTWSIDSSYRLSCPLLLFSPEKVMM